MQAIGRSQKLGHCVAASLIPKLCVGHSTLVSKHGLTRSRASKIPSRHGVWRNEQEGIDLMRRGRVGSRIVGKQDKSLGCPEIWKIRYMKSDLSRENLTKG